MTTAAATTPTDPDTCEHTNFERGEYDTVHCPDCGTDLTDDPTYQRDYDGEDADRWGD